MASEPERLERAPPVHRERYWREQYEAGTRHSALRHLMHQPVAVISLAFLLLAIAAALLAPLIATESPTIVDPTQRLRSPSAGHWFGTDDLGRDIFSRLVYGARVSLTVGVSVTLIAATLGSLLGLLAGYYYRLDNPIMRFLDGLMAFPGILLAIAIVVSLGARAINVVIALSIVYVPVVARLLRSTALTGKRQPFVEAARAVGLPDHTILRRYVLSNATTPLIVQCTFIFAYAIIAEASLSFLGASIDPETPTWGNMLRDGQRLLSVAWWIAVFPGIALFLTVLALNLLGDALRDALDPRARVRHQRGIIR